MSIFFVIFPVSSRSNNGHYNSHMLVNPRIWIAVVIRVNTGYKVLNASERFGLDQNQRENE